MSVSSACSKWGIVDKHVVKVAKKDLWGTGGAVALGHPKKTHPLLAPFPLHLACLVVRLSE